MPATRLYRIFIFVLFFFGMGQSAFAQVPAPPPTPEKQGQFPDPQFKKWTLGFNVGAIGYAPDRKEILSGNSHLSRTTNTGPGIVYNSAGKKRLAIIANTSLGVHGGIILSNKKGTQLSTIEGQFQSNRSAYSYNGPFVYTFRGDTFQRWVITDKYLCYGLSYQYSFSSRLLSYRGYSDFFYVKGTISRTFYHRDGEQQIYQGRYEDYTENGTGLTSRTIQANKSSYMASFEIGRRNFSPGDNFSFDFGIAAHIPFSNTLTNQYEFTQSNASVGKSNVTYSGAMVLFNMRFTFYKDWKEPERDTTIPPPNIYASTDTTREIDVQGTVTVHRKRITILVWDRNEVDGDVVSLFMNDEMVEQNLKLKKRKRRIRVKLNPGVNTLVMYAENLGEIPPNTAAIQVKEGRHKRNVNLVSDNGKSGAIEIVYEPR